jgi:hypothetical protein
MDLTIPPTLLARVDEVIETGLATSDQGKFFRRRHMRFGGQRSRFRRRDAGRIGGGVAHGSFASCDSLAFSVCVGHSSPSRDD